MKKIMKFLQTNKVVLSCDGDQFCVHGLDFINLVESVAGFGDTPHEALEDYLTRVRRRPFRCGLQSRR
jgi:hypothetical protein